MSTPSNAGEVATRLQHAPIAAPIAAPVQRVQIDPATRDVVDKLFERLKPHFPAWRQAWATEEDMDAAKREWIAEFMRAAIRSMEQIQCGIRRAARERTAWVPPPGTFVDWCFSPEAFGLPDLEKAYRIAMRNTHPAQAGCARWPHPALYHAAVAAGYLNLQRLERKTGIALFQQKYQEQCRRLGRGEQLPPAPVAAIQQELRKGSPEVANQALAGIRERLGVKRG